MSTFETTSGRSWWPRAINRTPHLTKHSLASARATGIRSTSTRGKFRTFLLTCFKRYMADEWDHQRAAKRGGGKLPLSLDFDTAETTYRLDPPGEGLTPEDVYASCWAGTLMERARRRMRDEMLEPGKEERFELLEGFVSGERDEIPYRDVAEALGLSESAVKVAVFRMRQRFGEILRAEVADTVDQAEKVDVEVRYVLAAAAG